MKNLELIFPVFQLFRNVMYDSWMWSGVTAAVTCGDICGNVRPWDWVRFSFVLPVLFIYLLVPFYWAISRSSSYRDKSGVMPFSGDALSPLTWAVLGLFGRHSKSPITEHSLKKPRKALVFFFSVIPRRLNFICRHFGTLCLFHLHWRCKQEE
jgi:hypothetical protein